MKYISHKLVMDEATFIPQYEITLSISLESIQDVPAIMSHEEAALVFGYGFLDVLEESKKWKATNQ
jgi:hypothetical protein